MMPLEAQVTSRALSERLKDLGVPQESLFYWIKRKELDPEIVYSGTPMVPSDLFWPPLAAAFTVAELGEIIHERFNLPVKVRKKWRENYSTSKDQATEADARALTLIYLIEQNLWKPEGK